LRSLRNRLPERRSERGVSSLELVLYMPLLMMAIFITVQFSLFYLGNQVVSSAARQAARVARTTGDVAAADAKGHDYANKVGHGLVENVEVRVTPELNGTDITVVVSGKALQLVPGIELRRVTKTVVGQRETFRQDLP
jgi:Flp pilus assembly protein TadG